MFSNGAELNGKRILLGVTGGIAAYKTPELVRLLVKAGAQVQVVMTGAAAQFVTPMTPRALSGRPVRQALFDLQQESTIGHIDLARWADFLLVAPASAGFMARMAAGMADDLLTTLLLACEAPIAVAPAMNRAMWANAATVDNVSRLKTRGVGVWGPAEGDQACGEVGPGRMVEPESLFQRIAEVMGAGPLQGVNLLLTAGPTREAIDPVRFVGNRSSGKMGFALARAFASMGASVTLVAGPVSLSTPAGVSRVDVESALEMAAAVDEQVAGCDLFV
ncbi:MAG: bifunctional phosphopantothenoylcysteine decarboxylase/phosphopantothenate--cysteine ligase CoaBC, partial [Gammaproteobacteria bacterium]|nr:bifunctional phosphopantothenoylcysteine decarboxylase/phosphopantothenate--cysteine ligase CoaBC [Gammaproteobacteria bacterium]